MPGRLTLGLTLNLLMGPEDLLPFFGAAIYVGLFDPGPKCPWDYLIYPPAESILLTYYLLGTQKKYTYKLGIGVFKLINLLGELQCTPFQVYKASVQYLQSLQ